MKNRGFTLAEVMMALGLMAIVVIGLTTMHMTAYSNTTFNGQRTTAIMLAQQRIEWLRAQEYTSGALAAGTTSETLSGRFAGYTRTTQIQNDVPLAGMKTITIATQTPSGLRFEVTSFIGS